MNPQPETEASNQPNPEFGPEANALKHGFCATKIVDPELKARAEAIHEHLVKIHDPWSNEEIEAVAELAQVLARQERLELAMDAKIIEEKARAQELYERSAQSAFETDLERFRQNPALHTSTLAQTWHGADWLESLWSRVEQALQPDASEKVAATDSKPAIDEFEITIPPFLPFHLICDAAAALGGLWQVDMIDGPAAWFLARSIRITPEPEDTLAIWITRSNAPDGPKATRALARRIVARAPSDPAICRAELVEKAATEKRRWAKHAKTLRPNYETALARAADTACGTGAGDPALEKDFRLLRRYLTTDRNRADRLKRRLDNLKKDRKTFAWRIEQANQREARRLRKASDDVRKKVDAQLARDNPDKYGPPRATRHPAYAARSYESREQEFSTYSVRTTPRAASKVTIAPATGPDPDDFETFEESAQTDAYQDDEIDLRNGIAPSDSSEIEATQSTESTPSEMQLAQFRRMLQAIPRNDSTFSQRLRLMRYRDWSDPADVMPDEAYTLRQLRGLPVCPERTDVLTKLFGTVDAYLDCWRAYCTWGDPKEIAEADALHQLPIGSRRR